MNPQAKTWEVSVLLLHAKPIRRRLIYQTNLTPFKITLVKEWL